ncbi:Pimeloyl-ACP methyl ester carboxylesterase [Pedococcus dokdonensis]|uniref:Pimeloyl-ACP methyl ester carboxylesterase n=1 Tax=Pedococcus dokdonensis TaxID=443156 RepID=A0A1H0S2K7_9MICO|nr:alpha/beta hydrolase [Pedococcus dokdonensis]SDP35982.1 Pimeloyl-ACP methyl ester carboxylesterase [Pedococcus dokdonensis]
MSPANRGLIGLGVGLAAAGAATAAGIAAGRVSKERHARLSVLAPAGAYAHTPDRELVVVADDGVPLHVEIDEPEPSAAAGPGEPADKPTVVFSHGFCLSLESWVLQRKALVRNGYRVVTWDQRGHGRSGRGSEASCDIDQLGRDLSRVIEETTPSGQLVLIGHSMGGMTMMALAGEHPELVRDRVVATAFVATSAGGAQLVSLGFGQYFGKLVGRFGPGVLDRLSARPGLVRTALRAGRDIEEFLVERWSFASPVPPAAVRLTGDMIFGTPLDVMADFLPTFDRHDKRHALVHFHGVEVLVLNGVHDVLTPPDHSEEIVRLVPGAEHVVIEEAGHIIMLEHPEVLNEQFEALIDRGMRAAAEGVKVARKPRVRRTVTDLAKRRKVARARRGEGRA